VDFEFEAIGFELPEIDFRIQSLEPPEAAEPPRGVDLCLHGLLHIWELLAGAAAIGCDLVNLCVWVKSNGGMGSLYWSRHELVFVLRNRKEEYTNNVQLGRFGRNRTNVWNYAGANSVARKGR
jgi:hypothetical protein